MTGKSERLREAALQLIEQNREKAKREGLGTGAPCSNTRKLNTANQHDIVHQLGYRVHIVRMWGRAYLDGFQFIYKHEETEELVEGPRTATALVDIPGATDLHEFMLYPDEYIVAVRGREGAWMDALELETVCSRIFRVGGNGGHFFERSLPTGSEVRLLDGVTSRHITNVQPKISPARSSVPSDITDTLYQLVLRHPAYRVGTTKMWRDWTGFVGLQVIFQRKTAPFDLFKGKIFSTTELEYEGPSVVVDLAKNEFVTLTLCRIGQCGGICELRLRTSNGRNISCGSSLSSDFAFACHTLANCEVRGLRSEMKCTWSGRCEKLEMHEIRLTDTINVDDFDSQFAAIIAHAVSPDSALASGVPIPCSYVDEEDNCIDFEDEMFAIPESVYHNGIPSVGSLQGCKRQLDSLLTDVRRDEDECHDLVCSLLATYEQILALHNREIAYAGLLVIRLMEVLKKIVTALEKSASFFSFVGRDRRMELFEEVDFMVRSLHQELERFTGVEARYTEHALTDGNVDSLNVVIRDAMQHGDWSALREVYVRGAKVLPLETVRDTLLIASIVSDELEAFIEVLQASPGGSSKDLFQMNEDGRTMPLAYRKHDGYRCDSCYSPIEGVRYRSIRLDDFDLCSDCYSCGELHKAAPFALGIGSDNMFAPIKCLRFMVNDSLLTTPVGAGAFRIVQWLVCHFGLNPLTPTIYRCNAFELCEFVASRDGEQHKELQLWMNQFKLRSEFMEGALAAMKSPNVSYEEMTHLVSCITSVYDIRTLFISGEAHLTKAKLKRILLEAFGRVLSEKLVLDNEASLVFDSFLSDCHKRGLLTQLEFMRCGRDNVRVNMENATWVKKSKRAFRSSRSRST